MSTRRRWALLLCLCPCLPAWAVPAPSAADLELQQLMSLLAQRRHTTAHFQQSQYLAALTRPLQSAGTLSYDAPDHLEQRIETPRRQLMVLEHGELTMQLGRHRRSVSLADYPELAPLLDSVRAMLAGDLAALQQGFEVELSGPISHWELELRPRAAALRVQLRDIRMRGEGVQILEVQIEQTNGEHSVMHIEPAA
jgi:hypothetical protein